MPAPPPPDAHSPHLSLQGFVEAVTRHTARGWARDPLQPGRRVMVQAVVQGHVLGQAVADLFRGDVAAAGLGDGHCGFNIDLSAHAVTLAGMLVTLRDAADGTPLQGSPAIAADPPSVSRFLHRWQGVKPPVLARLRRMMHARTRGGVSVIATGKAGLTALVASLQAQLCDRWELLLPPGASAPADHRIRVLPPGTGGLDAARHPIVLFVTDRAAFEADAIYHLLGAAEDPRAELFTWDLARTHRGSVAVDLLCRPAFSLDQFRGTPHPGGAFAARSTAARATGWGTGDADFALRLLERGRAVAHIPRILHRTPDPPRPPAQADLRAVQRHLDRGATGARANMATDAPGIVVTWPPAAGRTLVVIPTHNQAALLRTCVESLFRTRETTPIDIVVIDHASDAPDARNYLANLSGLVTVMPYTGPFHYARMNNLAVRRHGGDAETVLFLNNDTEAIRPGWLARMRSLAVRADVGAVGALLLYGDGRVQHAGAFLGFDGSATHAHTMVHAYLADGSRNPGYDGHLTALREVSAVTGACMMIRHTRFAEANGFDEALPIGFNDTDLCLRLRARGWRILQDGQSVLFHHESRTRRQFGQILHAEDTALFKARHAGLIAAGDPFYNPNLRLDVQDHEARADCLPGGAARLTFPISPPSGAARATATTSGSAAPRRRRSSG